MKDDNIEALAQLVREAGGTMTLYGKPVDARELRTAARDAYLERQLAMIRPTWLRTVFANQDPGDEDPAERQ